MLLAPTSLSAARVRLAVMALRSCWAASRCIYKTYVTTLLHRLGGGFQPRRRQRPLQGPLRGGGHRHRRVLPDHQLDAGRGKYRLSGVPSVGRLFLCAVTGIIVTALIVVITEYFTASRYNPVKSIAKWSVTGRATNIISMAVLLDADQRAAGDRHRRRHPGELRRSRRPHGRRRQRWPVRHRHNRSWPVSMVTASSSRSTPTGRSTTQQVDRRDGRPARRGAQRNKPLDAVGNTTKAITKGYAIGSARLPGPFSSGTQRPTNRASAPRSPASTCASTSLGLARLIGGLLCLPTPAMPAWAAPAAR